MGRELRRKQSKREGKSLKKEEVVEKNQIKQLISITILLVVIIGLIYLISALFITKELDWFDKNDDTTTPTLVSNTILASETFKQQEEEYYVYFYNYEDEDTDISSHITSKLSSSKVYKVDTNNGLNNKYVSEESNKKAKNLDELKVKAPTLIKVTGETIKAYYEGDEIKDKLK